MDYSGHKFLTLRDLFQGHPMSEVNVTFNSQHMVS